MRNWLRNMANGTQNPVADHVREVVVDRLEVVDIQHRDGIWTLLRRQFLKAAVEIFAVIEPGQRVQINGTGKDIGLLLQFLIGGLQRFCALRLRFGNFLEPPGFIVNFGETCALLRSLGAIAQIGLVVFLMGRQRRIELSQPLIGLRQIKIDLDRGIETAAGVDQLRRIEQRRQGFFEFSGIVVDLAQGVEILLPVPDIAALLK